MSSHAIRKLLEFGACLILELLNLRLQTLHGQITLADSFLQTILTLQNIVDHLVGMSHVVGQLPIMQDGSFQLSSVA